MHTTAVLYSIKWLLQERFPLLHHTKEPPLMRAWVLFQNAAAPTLVNLSRTGFGGVRVFAATGDRGGGGGMLPCQVSNPHH
jgi:hypothetical protein